MGDALWGVICMDEVTLYIADLVKESKLSQEESQIFLDYAYDLVLNGNDDEEIEFQIKSEIKQTLKEKENAKLF